MEDIDYPGQTPNIIESAAAPILIGSTIENQHVPRKVTNPIRKTKDYLDKQLAPGNSAVSDVVKTFVHKNLGTVLSPSSTFGEHGQPVPNVTHLVNPNVGFFTLSGLARAAGIYIFTFLLDPSRFYIGSSVALNGRVHGHKKEQKLFPNRNFYSLVAEHG